MTKSGKSTVSFAFLGKIYRFFEEIRCIKDRRFSPEFLSPKAASCLSEFTQIWREKPAKPLRLRVLFRQIVQTWRENQARSRRASGSYQARANRAPAHTAHLARNSHHSQRFHTRNPASTRNGYRVEITCDSRSRSHARLTCSIAVVARTQLHARLTCLRRYRLKSPPKMSETGRSV